MTEALMYRKILVPLDGSERAEKILPHVENLAVAYKSDIFLTQIVRTAILDDGYNILVNESMEATEHAMYESKKYLTDQAGKLKKKGLQVQTITLTGPVVKTILDAAANTNADLIAMASHGRSGLGRVFYGSVAAGVIQKTDRPLLIIRSRENE